MNLGPPAKHRDVWVVKHGRLLTRTGRHRVGVQDLRGWRVGI